MAILTKLLRFRLVPDFCIIYENQLKLKQIGTDKNRKYGRAQQLSTSEIMTILIMFQITQYRNFKTYYNEFIKIYWNPEKHLESTKIFLKSTKTSLTKIYCNQLKST